MPLVEIKDIDALINNKPFFDQPAKNKWEVYEKLVKMPRNDDCTMNYFYNQNCYKLIGIDLSREVNKTIFLHKLISLEN